MPKIYQTMLMQDNLPVIGTDPHILGARVPASDKPGKVVDITPDESGQVHPDTGGLSVAHSVYDFPAHLVPKRLNSIVEGATGSNLRFVWSMGKGLFFAGAMSPTLNLRLKPTNTPKQQLGLIEPAASVHLTEYQAALAQTQSAWSVDEPEPNEPQCHEKPHRSYV